jgi:hypothetical protein
MGMSQGTAPSAGTQSDEYIATLAQNGAKLTGSLQASTNPAIKFQIDQIVEQANQNSMVGDNKEAFETFFNRDQVKSQPELRSE